MTLPQPDWDHVLFGIDGKALGIYDGFVAWVMDDLTIVNRFAGASGWEDVADRTQEFIDRFGHLFQEGAMQVLSELEGAVEVKKEEDWRDI